MSRDNFIHEATLLYDQHKNEECVDLCDKELSNWKDGMSKKEELQDDEEEIQDDEPLTLINAQSKGHFS